MVGTESSVTAMSGQRPGETLNFKRLGWLAWLARASLLVLLMGLGGQSCLITASPELPTPKRTAPYLTPVNPPTYQVQPLTSGQGGTGSLSLHIEFKVTS